MQRNKSRLEGKTSKAAFSRGPLVESSEGAAGRLLKATQREELLV